MVKIFPDLSNSKFDIKYVQAKVLLSDVFKTVVGGSEEPGIAGRVPEISSDSEEVLINNIDGGFAPDVMFRNIDGGFSSEDYLTTQYLSGGTA